MKTKILDFIAGVAMVLTVAIVLIYGTHKSGMNRFNLTPEQTNSIVKFGDTENEWCTAFIISKHYAMTALHCIKSDNTGLISTGYVLDKKIVARVTRIDEQSDIVLLFGNFSSYTPLKVKKFGINVNDLPTKAISCGYPKMRPSLGCSEVTDIKGNDFFFVGNGRMLNGMSGGPSFDANTMEVVGVNHGISSDIVSVGDINSLIESWKEIFE